MTTEQKELVFEKVQEAFPGSMSGPAMMRMVLGTLRPYGLRPGNVIYGQSICSDEINNEDSQISSLMSTHWGNVFTMGGLGGAPYVGKTGFAAFSHHVPRDGHVVVLFGPHIGLSPDAETGKFLRKGQDETSTACGAAIAAYSQCMAGEKMVSDSRDMEQSWIREGLAPHCGKIQESCSPMVALVKTHYEIIEQEIFDIISTKFGSGNLVLIGGIQINMPYPLPGFFKPLHFSIQSASSPPRDLMPIARMTSPTEMRKFVLQVVQESFPGASSARALMPTILDTLRAYGLMPGNVIYGQSICSDEINNEDSHISTLMSTHWGNVFPMGGLGGAPYVGKTGFAAFSHHVPRDGHVVVLFGPHIGLTPDAETGKFLRKGQDEASSACGAAIAAYSQCLVEKRIKNDPEDIEQSWIREGLAPYCGKIQESCSPMIDLVMAHYEIIEQEIFEIINTNFGSGNLVLIGGIQINMPYPLPGFFKPLHFSIRSASFPPKDLLSVLD
jgi:hypothetical protein